MLPGNRVSGQSLFEWLLKKDNSVSIHGINLQFYATEM